MDVNLLLRLISIEFDSESSVNLEESETTGLDGKLVSKISGGGSGMSKRSLISDVSEAILFTSDTMNESVSPYSPEPTSFSVGRIEKYDPGETEFKSQYKHDVYDSVKGTGLLESLNLFSE